MTPSEFKAWFDGFTEALAGVPSEAQWARIKARVAEIDGRSITERVYIHRYGAPYWGYPTYPLYNYATSGGTTSGTITLTAAGNAFDSHSAMAALGRAESMQ